MAIRARRATHSLLKTWDDPSLDRVVVGWETGITISHGWVLYHVLEHFASHFGQICSLLHYMRDHDVPGLPEKRVVF